MNILAFSNLLHNKHSSVKFSAQMLRADNRGVSRARLENGECRLLSIVNIACCPLSILSVVHRQHCLLSIINIVCCPLSTSSVVHRQNRLLSIANIACCPSSNTCWGESFEVSNSVLKSLLEFSGLLKLV